MIPSAFRRSRGGAPPIPGVSALVILVSALAIAPGAAGRSVTLVWSLEGGACAAVPLQPVAADSWSGTVAIPHPELAPPAEKALEFIFMVDDDLLPAHYGYGGPGPFDVAFGPDPPNLAARVSTYGTWLFALDEARLTCSAVPAPGSARLALVFDETPEPVPGEVLAGTRARLVDQTAGLVLGTFTCAVADRAIVLTGLLPGRNYLATVSAPGYRTETVTFMLPETAACGIMVTLAKLVPGIATTWGDIKALYH